MLPQNQPKLLFLILKTKINACLCTLEYQCSIFRRHKSVQPRLQVCTQGYKSNELLFRACSYYQI